MLVIEPQCPVWTTFFLPGFFLVVVFGGFVFFCAWTLQGRASVEAFGFCSAAT